MKLFLPALFWLCCSASVSALRCYTCDSSDFNHDEYNKCDSHYMMLMQIEDCPENDSEFNTTHSTTEAIEVIDYVCYRSVYFHNDDGYIIMRGCEVRNICTHLEEQSKTLNNREMAIPTECEICDTDLCDPLENPNDEDKWYNDRCHNLEMGNFCDEEEDYEEMLEASEG